MAIKKKVLILSLLTILILMASILITVYSKREKPVLRMPIEEFSINQIISLSGSNRVYTQGLYYYNDTLLRSGGLYGKSTLDQLKYPSLEVMQTLNLDKKYFGEGIGKCGNYIYQLTWRENEVLQYEFPSLKLKAVLKKPNELKSGWGMCSSKEDNFIMYATDGSNKIFELNCRDPNELKVDKIIEVKDFEGNKIGNLNDLEIVNGKFYVNIYLTDKIAKIDSKKGIVDHYYSMKTLIDHELENGPLKQQNLNNGDCLNGIAYDSKRKLFIITGKQWGFFYEIKFLQ